MKKNTRRLLISSLLAFTCSIGIYQISQGWFDTTEHVSFDFSGASLAAYFAGGDGTESKPYIITNPRHLYNLAWLQYLGKFNGETLNPTTTTITQYHFELGADIDMKGWTLPPIGTALYPFIGSFNGTNTIGIDGTAIATANQKTYKISNLTVSNNYDDFNIVPYGVTKANFANCQIIGTFGIIGDRDSKTEGLTSVEDSSYGTKITASKNYVKNLYLDEVTIKTSATNTLAGILAGYVNGNLTDSGVHYCNIDYASSTQPLSGFATVDGTSKITKYSLIGDYNPDNVSYKGEPGASWGGSLNVKEMRDRIGYIANSGNTSWASTVYYTSDADSGSYPNKYYALPFVVSNTVDQATYTTLGKQTGSTYTSRDHNGNALLSNAFLDLEETAKENIGYVTGTQAKVAGKSIPTAFKPKSSTDFTFADGTTKYSYGKEITDFKIYTSVVAGNGTVGKHNEVTIDSNIKKTLLADFNSGSSSSEKDANRDIFTIRLSGQCDVNNPFTIPNLMVGGTAYSGDSFLPQNSLWFVPKEDGIVKLVLATENDGGSGGFTLSELSRSKNNTTNPFSSSFSTNKTIITSVYQDSAGKYYWNPTSTTGMTEVYNREWTYGLTLNSLYYFEIPVEGKKEYALEAYNGGAPYLVYLDLGQNGASGNTGNELSNIDFVDKSDDGTLTKVTSDNLSDVVFSATMGSGETVFYYRRKTSIGVLYFIEGGGTLTQAGSGTSKLASDKTCTAASTT